MKKLFLGLLILSASLLKADFFDAEVEKTHSQEAALARGLRDFIEEKQKYITTRFNNIDAMLVKINANIFQEKERTRKSPYPNKPKDWKGLANDVYEGGGTSSARLR